MHTFSTFQALPLHIAEKVAQYYVGTHRLCYSFSNTKENRIADAWKTLYYVSESWRKLAIKTFCKKITLTIAADIETSGFSFVGWPQSITMPNDNNYHIFVKDIVIDIHNVLKRIKETDLLILSGAWPSSLIFPVARTARVNIHGNVVLDQEDIHAAENEKLCWIVQRLQQSMPRRQEFKLYTELSFIRSQFAVPMQCAELKADNLLPMVLANFEKIDLNTTSIQVAKSYSHWPNSLCITNLRYNCKQNIELFRQIVKLGASSLISLAVYNCPRQYAVYLVQDNSGYPIIYPKLEKLDLSVHMAASKEDTCKTDSQIIPFPTLKHLKLSPAYAFADDTLFRGNSDTLEYLHIAVDFDFIKLLRDYNVFGDGKYQKLRCVVSEKLHRAYYRQLDSDEFFRFAFGLLSPATHTISLKDYGNFQPSINTISTCPYLDNLQALDIKYTVLGLSEMRNLIRLLPNLTDLCCTPGEDTADFRDNEQAYLPDCFSSTRHPLSRRLKCWVLPDPSSFRVELVAVVAATLTILCPSFTFAAVAISKRKAYHQALCKLMSSELYAQYSDRLLCLFNEE
ncbi:hypothetical protein BX070DRAFT_226652 [Coemansia spiralis]|nr:hypothetical protein BX070DRAFT_226652 [Coemansia spiralis]